MDSSTVGLPSTSNGKRKAAELSVVISPRNRFLLTYYRQQPWSLPDSIIYYITKNPSSSKVYEKFIQTCKYFFIKNPILVCKTISLKCENNEWRRRMDGKPVDFTKNVSKIWVTDFFTAINHATSGDRNFLSSVIPQIYQSDIKELNIWEQNISFNDLVFLAEKCEKVWFLCSTVMEEDGSASTLEKIFGSLPKVTCFRYGLKNTAPNIITAKTVQELLKIPHFSNLNFFQMNSVSEVFDIDAFFDYTKKNKKTAFELLFSNNLPEPYLGRLQKIVNEIVATKNHDYRIPLIQFDGNTYYFQLNNLYRQQRKFL